MSEITFDFTFKENEEGWTGGFSDYPVGQEAFYELFFEHSLLPPNLNQNTHSLKISGSNHSDDLFMFLKKHISGLKSNTSYRIIFHVEIASQYPQSSVGIGGSPGASVYLKIGATQIEPQAIDTNGFYSMNIDKGTQSNGGTDMTVIGTIGIERDEFVYTLIQRNNSNRPFEIQSDQNGEIWIIIGTDSGFEGITTLYYNSINVFLAEIHNE